MSKKHSFLLIHLTALNSVNQNFICLLRSALYYTAMLEGIKLTCFIFFQQALMKTTCKYPQQYCNNGGANGDLTRSLFVYMPPNWRRTGLCALPIAKLYGLQSMPCIGLTERLNCCILSSSGHCWCCGLTGEAALMGLFREATETLPQFPLTKGSFWFPSHKLSVSSLISSLLPMQLASGLSLWGRKGVFWQDSFFTLTIQVAFLSYCLDFSSGSCGDCSGGSFYVLHPNNQTSGNGLGQPVKELLMVLFIYLLGCREVKLWRKAVLGYI